MSAVVATATVGRVAPNPKRSLSPEDARRVQAALSRHERAYSELRQSVLDAAANGASVRTLAEFTGMSTNTISRWKADKRKRND